MTVESLQRNGLAGETHLIVYADQAKNKAAEVAVEQTRSYLRTIQGFKNVTIVERTENYGLCLLYTSRCV